MVAIAFPDIATEKRMVAIAFPGIATEKTGVAIAFPSVAIAFPVQESFRNSTLRKNNKKTGLMNEITPGIR